MWGGWEFEQERRGVFSKFIIIVRIMAVHIFLVCSHIQNLICSSKQPGAQEKAYHIVGAQWVFSMLWMSKSIIMCIIILIVDTWTLLFSVSITCWRTFMAGLAKEPGSRMQALCSSRSFNAFPSREPYTDGTWGVLGQVNGIRQHQILSWKESVVFNIISVASRRNPQIGTHIHA